MCPCGFQTQVSVPRVLLYHSFHLLVQSLSSSHPHKIPSLSLLLRLLSTYGTVSSHFQSVIYEVISNSLLRISPRFNIPSQTSTINLLTKFLPAFFSFPLITSIESLSNSEPTCLSSFSVRSLKLCPSLDYIDVENLDSFFSVNKLTHLNELILSHVSEEEVCEVVAEHLPSLDSLALVSIAFESIFCVPESLANLSFFSLTSDSKRQLAPLVITNLVNLKHLEVKSPVALVGLSYSPNLKIVTLFNVFVQDSFHPYAKLDSLNVKSVLAVDRLFTNQNNFLSCRISLTLCEIPSNCDWFYGSSIIRLSVNDSNCHQESMFCTSKVPLIEDLSVANVNNGFLGLNFNKCSTLESVRFLNTSIDHLPNFKFSQDFMPYFITRL
ncbi:hypothetical protein RCL1_002689 [Eukaryota sp. TZLM3-RCL]